MHLLCDFVVYRVLIILPVEVAIDTLIHKTTATAILQGGGGGGERGSHFDVIFVEYCIVH